MKIIWSKPTRQDLREIFDYIIEEDPHVARALFKKIKDRVLLLQSNPQIG